MASYVLNDSGVEVLDTVRGFKLRIVVGSIMKPGAEKATLLKMTVSEFASEGRERADIIKALRRIGKRPHKVSFPPLPEERGGLTWEVLPVTAWTGNELADFFERRSRTKEEVEAERAAALAEKERLQALALADQNAAALASQTVPPPADPIVTDPTNGKAPKAKKGQTVAS